MRAMTFCAIWLIGAAIIVIAAAEIPVSQTEITGRAAEIQAMADEWQAEYGWFVDVYGIEFTYNMWIVTGWPPLPVHSNQDRHSNQDYGSSLNPVNMDQQLTCYEIGTLLCGSPPICVNCDVGCIRVACQGDPPAACNQECWIHAHDYPRFRPVSNN